MRCLAHVLNLVVQDGLEYIQSLNHKIRETVKYVKSSTRKKQEFETSLALFGLIGKEEQKLDVQTKWNSTCLMLKAA